MKKKKVKSYKKIIILSCLALILIIILTGSIIKVNFILDEEIVIKLDPQYTSASSEYGEENEIIIHADYQNHWLCSAKCEYEFVAIDDNSILENGTFEFSSYRTNTFIFNTKINDYGYGQKIYLFKITCANQVRGVCPTSNANFTRRTIQVVNYEPNEEQKKLAENFKQKLTKSNELIANTEQNLINTNNILESLSKEPEKYYEDKYKTLNSNFFRQKYINENELKIWETQNYTEMNVNYDELIKLNNDTNEFLKETKLGVNQTNEIIIALNNIKEDVKLLKSINITRNETKINNMLNETLNKLNKYVLLKNHTLHSNNIKEIRNEINLIKNEFSSTYEPSIDLALTKDLICIKNNENCSTINLTTQNTTQGKLTQYENECQDTNQILDTYNSSNELETRKIAISLLIEYEKISNNQRIQELKDELITQDIENETLENYYPNEYNKTNAKYLNPLLTSIKNKLIANKCQTNNLLEPTNLPEINHLPEEINILPKKLPDIKSMCCAYNKCGECNSQKTPLILLHGHSFSGKSNAYTSTESLTELENQLEKDELYIVTGILNPQENPIINDLGKSRVPIAIKPTYYVDYYNGLPGFKIQESKQNNIDSYAIRLEEIINYVKKVTGSEKVDIVAHSMGGLVTRRYIQVFGDESINKFIMVATPNHGTDSQTTYFCKIFGEENECNDMDENSFFIQKLNNDIKTKNAHLIIGKGCTMPNGQDGDGIVTVESAKLEGANITYIDGECEGLQSIHTKLLEPEEYPKVYEKIVEILNE